MWNRSIFFITYRLLGLKIVIEKKLRNIILTGDFEEAAELLINLDRNEVARLLTYIAWKTENLTLYGFIGNLLIKKEDPFWHSVAAQMLLVPLCYIEGAYPLGLYHIRRASLLEPDNIEHKEFMLAFHNLPEPLLTKQEAITIAQEVLAEDPKSEKALQILSDYGVRYK